MNWYAIQFFDGTTSCRHELQAHSAADAIVCFETFRPGKKASRVTCIEAPAFAASPQPESPPSEAAWLALRDIFKQLPKGSAITDVSPSFAGGFVVTYRDAGTFHQWMVK